MSDGNLPFKTYQTRQGRLSAPPNNANDAGPRKISETVTPPVTAVLIEPPVPPSPPNSPYRGYEQGPEEIPSNHQNETVGKPQIWVRIKPTPIMESGVLKINEDGKSLNLMVDHEDRNTNKGQPMEDMEYTGRSLNFEADGILKNSNQEETYAAIVDSVIEKAMNGTSGVIMSLGPELSGKSFTMFGNWRKFQYRGIIPRALEKIFQTIEQSPQEIQHRVRIGILEIRKDHVRDLLTLSPYDLRNIGPNGPIGMLLQQIGCAEHGLGLLIRALNIHKHLPREEPSSRYHIIVYVDIEAEVKLESGRMYSKARLTFAKIAAVPKRAKLFVSPEGQEKPQEILRHDNCIYVDPKPKTYDFLAEASTKPCSACCGPVIGDMGEAIAIRRDLFLLEQMFVRSNELRRLNRYYNKLKKYGMQVFMKKPKPSPSQYFRQSKLAHCLQDIVSGNTEIRIILHLRLERQYMYTALEIMRFAERAKCVPFESKSNISLGEQYQTELKNQKRVQVIDQFHAQLAEVEKEFSTKGPELTGSFINLKLDEMKSHLDTLTHKTTPNESKVVIGGMEDEVDPELTAQLNEIYQNFKQAWLSNFERDEEEELERLKSYQDYEEGMEMKEQKESRKRAKKDKRQKSKNKERKGGNVRQGSIAMSQGSEPEDALGQSDGGNIMSGGSTADLTEENKNEVPQPVSQAVPVAPDTESPKLQKFSAIDLSQARPTPSGLIKPSLEMISEEMESELPTKAVAWDLFIKTENGAQLSQELELKQKELNNAASEHSSTLKLLSNILSSINQKQTELDLFQQERHLKGEIYDESNNVIILPGEKNCLTEIKALNGQRDGVLLKVKDMKSGILEQKKNIDLIKMNVDLAFQDFCLEHFAMIFEGDEGFPTEEEMVPRAPQPQPALINDLAACECRTNEELESHFEQLKTMAKEQAKYILKQMPKRKPWIKY